jgi:pentatricopeptide repeat protein
VGTALVDVGRCGYIESTCKVFDRMRHRDVVTRNAMITGFMQNGSVDGVAVLFGGMSC